MPNMCWTVAMETKTKENTLVTIKQVIGKL